MHFDANNHRGPNIMEYIRLLINQITSDDRVNIRIFASMILFQTEFKFFVYSKVWDVAQVNCYSYCITTVHSLYLTAILRQRTRKRQQTPAHGGEVVLWF